MTMNSIRALCAAILMLACTSARASQSLLEVVRSCESQTDSAARLKCYDRGVAQFKGVVDSSAGDPRCVNAESARAPVAAPRPTSVAQSALPAGPTNMANAADEFGLTSGQVLAKQAPEERPPPLKHMTARIISLRQRAGGSLVLHLDNEQVWEQTEAGPELPMGPGDSVTIDRGVLGAYWLSGTSSRRVIKVRRLQ